MSQNFLESLLQQPGNTLSFAVEYGSGQNDWDVLAVYENAPPRNEIIVGRLDMLAIDERTLAELICKLDPAVTEPLFTGKVIAGDEDTFQGAQSALNETKPEWPAIQHLLIRSQDSYRNAQTCKQSRSSYAAIARTFWNNLSWALSYRAFAQYYSQRLGKTKAAITVDKLVSKMPGPIGHIWERI